MLACLLEASLSWNSWHLCWVLPHGKGRGSGRCLDPRALGQATGSQWGLHLPCPRWRESSRHNRMGPVVGLWEEWPASDLCSWPCLWAFSQAAGPCLSSPVLWSQDQDGYEDQEILSLRAEFKECIQNLHNHYKKFSVWYFKNLNV